MHMTMTINIYINVNINAYGNDCKYIKVKMTYSFTDDMSWRFTDDVEENSWHARFPTTI